MLHKLLRMSLVVSSQEACLALSDGAVTDLFLISHSNSCAIQSGNLQHLPQPYSKRAESTKAGNLQARLGDTTNHLKNIKPKRLLKTKKTVYIYAYILNYVYELRA